MRFTDFFKTGSPSALLAAILLSTLAACAPHGDGHEKSAATSGLQLDLRSQAMQATPLTASQKAEIVAISKAQTEFTPDTSLYFDQAKDADENKKSLAQLNDTGRTYIDLVKQKCKIDPGTDQKSGDAVAGKSQTILSHQNISGDDCPISYDTSSKSVTNFTSIDTTNEVMTGTLHFDGTNSSKVNDAKMGKNTYIIDTEISTSGDMTYTNYKSGGVENSASQGSLHQKFTGKGTMATVDQKSISLIMTMELSSTPGIQSKQALYNMTLPSGGTVVLWEQKVNGELKILVNSEKYTPERLKAELGWFGNTF